jgi:hypothetical protein
MSGQTSKTSIAMIVWAAMTLGAFGATYYVDSGYDGSLGTPNGATNRPFTTLAAAAAAYASGSGHIILVAGGNYRSVSEGGQENFGVNGYNLAAKAGSWKGGYAGWLGAAAFDWTEASRTFPDASAIDPAAMTVVNLTNANSRAFYSSGADHVLTFDGFVFRDSLITTTNYDGGALVLNGIMSSAAIYNCVFLNNRTTRNGGGAWFGGRGSTSTNVVCIGNAATNGFGGGLYVQSGNTGQNFSNCVFTGNTAKYGGGLGTGGSQSFLLVRCLFEDNVAALYGGAVGVGAKSIINGRQSRFTGNTAGRGSALGNTETYSGIGINLDNCLVANNVATNEGYAIFVTGTGDTASTMLMRHSTIVTNLLGGIHFRGARSNENSTFSLQNVIVAYNTSNGLYCNMPLNSLSRWGDPLGRPRIAHSIFYGNTSNIAWAGEAETTYSVTNLYEVDPAFAGADASDFRLAWGSPAIDAGLNLGFASDLDGAARPTRLGYDLGAYEEWQVPIITNRVPVVDSSSALARAEFAYESTGLVTYAWFVLDTIDKGTNMANWGAVSTTGPQAQGVIFGALFSGLLPAQSYVYRCVASNDHDVIWGDPSIFTTPPAGGSVRLWTGAGTNTLAGNTNNWLDGLAPGPEDSVLLDGFSGNIAWNSNAPPTVARWTQTESYTGVVTLGTLYPGQGAFTNFAVTGDCLIYGGSWKHEPNTTSSNLRKFRLSASVGGSLAVGPLAAVNCDGLGYRDLSGPGAPGTHGGQVGHAFDNTLPPQTYGEIRAPIEPGSGGGWGGNNAAHGGGAVLLTVSGHSTIDGRITVVAGNEASGAPQGAGGSIWLRTGTLSGNGVLDASALQVSQGGGGRIAVIVNSATSFGSVQLKAYGGPLQPGAAGTIYKESTAHAPGNGILVIDNNNASYTILGHPYFTYAATLMPKAGAYNAAVNLADFSEIVLTNKGVLGINTDTAVDLGSAAFQMAGRDSSYLAVRGTNALVFPDPFVISNFTLLVDSNVSAAGSWTVTAQGRLAASVQRTAATQTDTGSSPIHNPLNLTLSGDLTVDAGGVVTMAGAGHGAGAGLGRAFASIPQRAASHGGQGGATNLVGPLNKTYGSVTNPATPGSGGFWGTDNTAEAGGVMRLSIGGNMIVNGSILANGLVTEGQSGGSIFLRTGTLSGSGLIDASGYSGGTLGGGGGRIALYLTDGSSRGGVAVRAFGGDSGYDGAAGTVYEQGPGQEQGSGTLYIDNNGLKVTTNAYTVLPAMTNGLASELDGVTVVVTNFGRLRLSADVAVKDAWFFPGTVLDLATNTLYIRSRPHAIDATVINYGAIVWQPPAGGILILIK